MLQVTLEAKAPLRPMLLSEPEIGGGSCWWVLGGCSWFSPLLVATEILER
jgi:hypothetical protein